MIETQANIEQSIQSDVEVLRSRFSNTQDLYRETCALLFFRYGITPTANKLYQFVRKGSMSAPAEALTRFWDELRSKSRVRLDTPDMPETLNAAAVELIGALWQHAQIAAHESMATLKAEVQTGISEAQRIQHAAEEALDSAKNELTSLQQSLSDANARVLQLERELSSERATKESLLVQIDEIRNRELAQEAAARLARLEFAAELEKLRELLTLSEDRCRTTEQRVMLDLDRERVIAQRLQKELTLLRQQHSQATENHLTTLAAALADLGSSRHLVGLSEGKLHESHATVERLTGQLDSVRNAAAELESKLAILQRDHEQSLDTNANLENEVARRKEELVAMHAQLESSMAVRRKTRRTIPSA